MPEGKNTPKKRNEGSGGLDANRFMYEVSDEIRAGLDEDKKKAGAADQSKSFDKQATHGTSKSFEKQVSFEPAKTPEKETEWEKSKTFDKPIKQSEIKEHEKPV
jgi:hypothetical protein